MKEFKINKYITLKLENGKTSLYVDGKYFRQCIQLMLNIPKSSCESDNSINTNNLNSIDEIAEALKTMDDNSNDGNSRILPEQEFQDHLYKLK